MKLVISTPMTVLEALSVMYPDSSKRTLRNWLKNGRFTVDLAPIDQPGTPLEAGQVLRSSENFSERPELEDVKIIFEHRSFLVIEKPEDLLSTPLDYLSTKKHVLGLLRTQYKTDQIFAVHRIDRETSGILVFARGVEAERAFQHLFETHNLHREYFAIVEGRMHENQGTWRCFLRELPNLDVEPCQNPSEGKEAITHFEVLKRSTKYTYLRLTLETGKKHQIRVHCKQAGFPVLGDRRYGATQNPLKRLALHARKLRFQDPFTERLYEFISPIPLSFKKLGATELALFPIDNER